MEEVFLSQGATFETYLSTVGGCDAIDDKMSELLPAPFGPNSPKMRPSWALSETSLRAVCSL